MLEDKIEKEKLKTKKKKEFSFFLILRTKL
jgi:hypothetical protein